MKCSLLKTTSSSTLPRPPTGLYQFSNRLINYQVALDWQRTCQTTLLSQRHLPLEQRTTSGYVLLLEHEPVYTFGRASLEHHVLDPRIQAIRVERGGEVTYHGPGQLVGYLILDLEYFKKDLHCLVSGMEKSIIFALQEMNLPVLASSGGKGKTGVWLGNEKICAIGLSCRQWVSMHGFALNVNLDCLQGFQGIVPCGLPDAHVTSMQSQLGGRELNMEDVKKVVARSLNQVLDLPLELKPDLF